MWRELITELTRDIEPTDDLDPGPQFSPGAIPAQLDDVEHAVGMLLPCSLQDVLEESNGVFVVVGQHLTWSTDEIVKTNHVLRTDPRFREQYKPFNSLLFFGDAGVDGICYAIDITDNDGMHEEVYAWYPISDERDWKASSLRAFVEGWLTGKLSV